MTKLFSLLVPLFFIFTIYGQSNFDSKKLNQNEKLSTTKCIDSLEIKIEDFYYGMNPLEIIQIMGNPDSIDKDFYTISENWIYSDICFGISNDHVYYISTESDNYSTPSGIRTGLSILDVSNILNKDMKGLIKNNEIQFVNCSYEIYFIFEFNSSNILEKLEIGIDLPEI
ncbi:MAG: hypothetical protein B6D64_02450 [Bacteroidetes bacterium 4484_276]|nr:MAG: hypothetical protein B6D64_02450 [Bacteroidetes bacterium 4484_276]OYT12915.1 MAG: hypothetical protein B6I19_07860 [Bacteroidetes bacterium 4572_114]